MWTEQELEKLPNSYGFRLRGLETTRLDTFIDAAFAFAITMLVISIGDIPDSEAGLTEALKGAPAFGMSFISIIMFWLGHRRWSRRYGLEDSITITLSLSLIFVMLIYVYPLKLMFSAMANWISLGFLPSEFKLTKPQELVNLFAIYGFGFFALTTIMMLLHLRARKIKNVLQLNEMELLITHKEIMIWFILSLTGFASAFIALVFPIHIAMFAGFAYFNLPVSIHLAVRYFLKKEKKLKYQPKLGSMNEKNNKK